MSYTHRRRATSWPSWGRRARASRRLMNIIGCLDRPTCGRILPRRGGCLHARPATSWPSIRNQKIGFVFQSFNLLSRTTALENVELPLLYADAPSARTRHRAGPGVARRRRAQGPRDHHKTNQLSGGEQQRVAIARALLNNPTAHPGRRADRQPRQPDAATRSWRIFKNLNEEKGITIVMVTHEPDIAACASGAISPARTA
ncbi:MAG: ABC transporter ATP-binding protein [Desulfomicrobium escambiense]|nr:ABC transporter ATP-binding protein [Desulfomicrobium escambiense]